MPAYSDVWSGGLADYLTFMAGLLARLRDVLADDGWLCLHCDHRTSAHVRLLLDELFGPDGFRNEIVWSYGLGNGTSRRGFPRKHDTLLLYAKSAAAVFTPIRGAVSPAMANKYRHVRPDGTRFMRSYGREYDLKGGKPVGSVWEIPSVAPTSGERTGYPTQKPRALLERLIAATTAPGDTVLDPCCGSGTTLLAAGGLGRQSVGIDASWLAIATARAHLVASRSQVSIVVAGHQGHGQRAASSSREEMDPPARPGDRTTSCGLSLAGRPAADPDCPEATGRPVGGYPSGPSREFRPIVSIQRAIATGLAGAVGPLTVTIDGLAVTGHESAAPPSPPFRVVDNRLVRRDPDSTPLTDHWSDWLTGWAVHLGRHAGQPETPFVAVASSHRTGRSRALETTLIVSKALSDDLLPEVVTVRLYDMFGASSDHVFPTGAG